MRAWLIAAACVVAAAAAAGAALGTDGTTPSQAPDTIVHNGRITTMDGRGSVLTIVGGRVVYGEGSFAGLEP